VILIPSQHLFHMADFERKAAAFAQAARGFLSTRQETLSTLRRIDSELTERGEFTHFVKAESAVASVGSAALLVAGGPITAGVFAVGAVGATLWNGHNEGCFQQKLVDELNRQLGADGQAQDNFAGAKRDWDATCGQYRKLHGDEAFQQMGVQWSLGDPAGVGAMACCYNLYAGYSGIGGGMAIAQGNAAFFEHTGASVLVNFADEGLSVGSSLARGGQAAGTTANVGKAAAGASSLAIGFAALGAAVSTWQAVSYDPKKSSSFHEEVTKLIPEVEISVSQLRQIAK